MKCLSRLGLPIAACLVVCSSSAQAPLGQPGGEEYAAGVMALQGQRYAEAIGHFENALELNPKNCNAQMYVATAYAQQYKPGVDGEDNTKLADQAIENYKKLIECGVPATASASALKAIGNLDAQMKKFDDAKEAFNRAKELDPKDPEPYYLVAALDLTLAQQFRQAERTKLHMKPQEWLADKNKEVCGKVSDANWTAIDEGMDNLNKAMEMDPNNGAAKSCMSLLYRERADVRCNDPGARAADLKAASEWAQKPAVPPANKAANR